MCGIIFYLSKTQDSKLWDIIYNGLIQLQNRGYDSSGIASVNQNLIISKYASTDKSSLDLLKQDQDKHSGKIGIGHNRWRSHGDKSIINSHPHTDNLNRIALVHNGIIENYISIKRDLLEAGYTFKSETDTEVVAVLIGFYLDKNKTLLESMNLVNERIEGSWAIAVISKDEPDKIILSKHGSPLLVGFNQQMVMGASESSAFPDEIKEYLEIPDGKVLEINKYYSETKNLKKIDRAKGSGKENYEHWTLKEIMEQPKSVMKTLRCGDEKISFEEFDRQKDKLLKIEHLLIVACGTSFYAGLLGSKFLKRIRHFVSVQTIDASEFNVYDIPKGRTAILFLSQSGETKDVHRALQLARQVNLFIISIVNVVGSLIARESDLVYYLHAGKEIGVASTKSFTSQVVAMITMSIWFSENPVLSNSLKRIPLHLELMLREKDQYLRIAEYLKNQNLTFVLGKDLAEPIAYEGALKIKEITYINAQGYSGGALKHGPFALIEKGTPVILIILNDEHLDKMNSTAEEVHSRGAYLIVITNTSNINHAIFNEIIKIPENKSLGCLLSVIPLQLIAYYTSVAKEINCDMPRCLAKVVTID